MRQGFVKKYFEELNLALAKVDYGEVERLIEVLRQAGKEGKMIFFIGNGGSASTATHLAADVGKNTVTQTQKIRYKTMALTDNVAWMTAVGNDLAYEDIFVEQLKNFAQEGDVLVAISGSGNSPNVLKALEWAGENRLKTGALLGFDGGKAKKMSDMAVVVPVKHYGYVEGIHSEIHHCVVEALKLP